MVKRQLASDVQALIERFGLSPHPEGGFFAETYRSSEAIRKAGLPARFGGDRSLATAIYFLLPGGTPSRLHRIAADEVWHFYAGDPLQVVEIHSPTDLRATTLGQNFAAGERPQHVVPYGCWFGSVPVEGARYSLVGCTVAPGFDFADFEMGDPAALLREYPEAAAWIRKLCP